MMNCQARILSKFSMQHIKNIKLAQSILILFFISKENHLPMVSLSNILSMKDRIIYIDKLENFQCFDHIEMIYSVRLIEKIYNMIMELFTNLSMIVLSSIQFFNFHAREFIRQKKVITCIILILESTIFYREKLI